MAIITISRGSLSGGAALAQRLGQALGAEVISHEAILEAARRYGVAVDVIRAGLQRPPTLWHRLTHHKQRYLVAVQAVLAEMVANWNAVYHGLAGQLMLRDLPGVIKIRLIAPMEYRVQAAMAELGLNRDDATRHIRSVDEERERWVRLMYGASWTDPGLYDLILNLGHLSLDEACDLVVALAHREERQVTPELEAARRDFVLQAKVRAELLLNAGFPEDQLSVRVFRGKLELSGAFYESHRSEVIARVRRVPGAEQALPDRAADAAAADEPQQDGEDRTIRAIMLPADAYPTVTSSSTVREAITALGASSVKLADGHIHQPRFVLVQNERGELAGILTRRDLLRALVPQLAALRRAREHLEGMSSAAADEAASLGLRWVSFFGAGARACAEEPVAPWVSAVRCVAAPDDDVSAIVAAMLGQEVDLVPVLEGRRLVGVVLMTDVFHAVAEFVVEGGRRSG
ncbi:MAG: cytidylate kinase family protein [Deltaproteobacteria bacterium]|jgi:CBS domain-containing protein/cytidylate kinase|nr:cytidylate kinase family protein [Deltaproteobacteria bacterium]MBW2533518.1 cytidylate kinase family protein [Deltaproteobacteria bacterium]